MEIEIKLTYQDKSKVVDRVKELGFTFDKTTNLSDTYFGIEDQSMSNKSKLFRIRDKDGKTELTLKDGLTDNKGIWTRREINVGINNIDGVKDILQSLGCKFIKENRSTREIWKKDDVSFEFISFTVPAVLKIIEIEASSENSINDIMTSLSTLVTKAGEDVFAIFDKK